MGTLQMGISNVRRYKVLTVFNLMKTNFMFVLLTLLITRSANDEVFMITCLNLLIWLKFSLDLPLINEMMY